MFPLKGSVVVLLEVGIQSTFLCENVNLMEGTNGSKDNVYAARRAFQIICMVPNSVGFLPTRMSQLLEVFPEVQERTVESFVPANDSGQYGTLIRRSCIRQDILKAGKETSIASLAKERKWFAIRARMRRGLVAVGELKTAKVDGKTAVEWIKATGEEWKVSCPPGEDSTTPSKIIAEMVYRYVSSFFSVRNTGFNRILLFKALEVIKHVNFYR